MLRFLNISQIWINDTFQASTQFSKKSSFSHTVEFIEWNNKNVKNIFYSDISKYNDIRLKSYKIKIIFLKQLNWIEISGKYSI